MRIPFEGLRPASGRDHVVWVVEAMGGQEGVDLVVPGGFEAYARIHHRIHNGERWADFAPEYLARGVEMFDYLGSKLEFIDGDGNLDAEHVDTLVPLLAGATATPDECHYALWQGWGWVHPGSTAVLSSARAPAEARAIERTYDEAMAQVWNFAATCPVEPWWGGRDMILFDGAVDSVSTVGHRPSPEANIERQSPQWWWPEDRAWFVGTEIDDAWTYVAGGRSLIDEILTTPQWESVRVEPTDRW
jgi:hypothetical protein